MRNVIKIIKFAVLASFVAGFFLFHAPVYAQEEFKNKLEQIAEKIAQIKEIKKDKELSWLEKNEQETALRKEILSSILYLTILENKDLEEKLASIEDLTENQEEIRDALLEALKENDAIFELIQERIEDADSLKEIKQIANDFNNWRTLVYNPKVGNIVTFTIVFRQKNVLEITQRRLERIREDLQGLEDADLLKDSDVDKLLEEAIKMLGSAEELNNKAEENMVRLLNRKLFSKTRFGLSYFLSSSSVKKSVTKSLNQVKDTYRIFIKIGKLARSKMGLK